jgi:hypothetical protein
MSGIIPVHDGSAPKTAKVALYLGLGSVAALLLSIVGGLTVDSLGVVTLFRSYVTPLSLAAIIVGFLARRKIQEESLEGYRLATTGLILGIITLALVALTIILVVVFFAPMLFLS